MLCKGFNGLKKKKKSTRKRLDIACQQVDQLVVCVDAGEGSEHLSLVTTDANARAETHTHTLNFE